MNEESFLITCMRGLVQHYNHKKYWRMREYVIKENGFKPLKVLYLFRIKRMDAFNGASFGTHLGYGAKFDSVPNLPHGINGIIISDNAIIGHNVSIFHQVTIGEGKGGAPIIGDNVLIGPGAKIVGNVRIGNGVKIGANCVIAKSIPPNTTVVMSDLRLISKPMEEK